MITPFRGDKVTVIDFGKRKLKDAYQWNPRLNVLGAIKADQTQDFIKFFFTGPKLQAGNVYDKDDISTWRSILQKGGSVQHLKFLTDHEKEVFKTFGEISQKEILIQAAQRQPLTSSYGKP